METRVTGLTAVEVSVAVGDGATTQNVGMTSEIYRMGSFVVESERTAEWGQVSSVSIQRSGTRHADTLWRRHSLGSYSRSDCGIERLKT